MAAENPVKMMLQADIPRESAEPWVAEYALGVADALESGELSAAQASGDLFSVENYRLAKERLRWPPQVTAAGTAASITCWPPGAM